MKTTNDERCTAVLAYLASFFCTYKVLSTAVSVRTEGEWEYDMWHVEWFRPEGMKYVMPYRTGIGHRKASKPVAPDVLGPLNGWLFDASCADGHTFKNFCAELGYGTDSTATHKIYLACQDQLDKLQEFFTHEQIAHLRDMMEGY